MRSLACFFAAITHTSNTDEALLSETNRAPEGEWAQPASERANEQSLFKFSALFSLFCLRANWTQAAAAATVEAVEAALVL